METPGKRRLAAILISILLTLPLIGHSAEPVSFAIVGDTRIGARDSVYRQFIEKIKAENIAVIFHTGDVIDRAGSEDEWREFLKLTGSGRTTHIALGNHDVKDLKSLEVYERLLNNPPYYAITSGDTQFIILCTEMPGQAGRIVGKQLDWLTEALKKPLRYRFVFLHRPPYPTVFGAGYSLDRYQTERDNLHALFVASKVNAVIAGHEHLYHRSVKDGIVYVTTGGGGGRLHAPTAESGGFYHYLIAKRANGGYVVRAYGMDGSTRDEFHIEDEVKNG
jgi:acid phosphatase type 7